MTHYLLKPEVAGGEGENTVMDVSVHPPRVERLEYEIEGWLGDELLESFPCFVISTNLADKIVASGHGSFELRDVEMSLSPEGEEALSIMGFTTLPEFKWFYVTGTAGRDDIGLTQKADLVVSDRSLEVLRHGRLEHCDIEEYDPSQHG